MLSKDPSKDVIFCLQILNCNYLHIFNSRLFAEGIQLKSLVTMDADLPTPVARRMVSLFGICILHSF